ncbi:hypothetical protein [Nocardioides sp. SLBN-35]|uniref:hypothetical protein n=1 Tax=Nocardioides sp. SLBN-35 TaxID=2768445 RepID=UPI0011505DB7|nr:hypothetical protein [Nocardioides sp. SLBN-35]TQK69291.1 hypothetical protein FBY23_1053 [Nocardioides sp. SLBN-35]
MQDITDRLGAELRTPPPPTFDVAATVGAGRRAVRRRRLARGSAALALALVIGGAGVAVTSRFGGTQVDGSVQVAAGVSAEGLASTAGLNDDFPAGYDPQDEHDLLVRNGWEVVDRIDGPVDGMFAGGSEPIADSVALALRKGGDITFVLLFRYSARGDDPRDQSGGGNTETSADSGYHNLSSWVAYKLAGFTEAAQ